MNLKKLLALVLSFAMLLSTTSLTAFATEADYVAKIGETEYADFDSAITSANEMTGDVTVEIYALVEYTDSTANLTGTYDSINFVGMNSDAGISITRNGNGGYISGVSNDCAVTFKGLTLSKPEGGYADDAGFMNVAFSVYRVGSVAYTDCTFPNGACAAGCPTTYTGCEFGTSHDKYGLWAYGTETTVTDSEFVGTRAIKMYAEGSAKTTDLTVSGSDFSRTTGGKPDIILSLGESITLSDNTYSGNGVLRLETTSAGTVVTSDDVITCIDDATGNACGVLVDGKIYTTVTEAAEVAEAGDTVTLLYDTEEEVVFAEGVTVDTNDYNAPNVSVEGEDSGETETVVAQVGDVECASLAEAFAKAVDGDTVTLLADVAIDTETYTIADGISLTLNMNGKKITVTDNATGNYELFYIYGELTVIGDGTIELTSTNNREWNAMSAIFHNRGGVLTIENGTFKNLGGTDMAWVVDNSGNWYGDATTNIEGGTLTSTYTAIRNRMEQNSHGASGTAILNISGGYIDGTTSAVWAQAASVSETAPATGEINVTGGEIGLINTARSAGAECMTTISGGTVAGFKGEVGELTVTDDGEITGTVTILTADGEEANYIVDENGVYIEAPAGPVEVATFEELVAALANGGEIKLTTDITTTAAIVTSGVTSVIDLNGKTLTIGAGDNKFNDASNITIKNGNINITGVTVNGNAIICLDEYEKTLVTTLTLDNVNLTGNGYSSAYGIFYIGASSVLNVNGGTWNLTNDTFAAGGVFKADSAEATLNIDGLDLTAHNVRRVVTYANTTIDNATMTITGDADGVDAEMEHGFNRSPLTITNSTITMKDMVGRGITAECGAVTISENSTVTIANAQEATIDVRAGQTVTVDSTSTVTVDAEPTLTSGTISGNVTVKTTPTGDASIAYIKDDCVYGEATGNASESWVMKVLDAEGNVMGTTSLNNIGDIIDGDVTVTWNLLIDAASNTDSYWTMEWTTAPTADNIPASVELWIDGVAVDTGVVKLNRPDDSYPVIAAVTDDNGVIESFVCANGYTNNMRDVAASLAAAMTDDANIVLLRDITLTEKLNVSNSVALDGNGHTISAATDFSADCAVYVDGGNVTVKNATFSGFNTTHGVLRIQSATATVSGCTFTDNTATLESFAVVSYNHASGSVTGCTFTENTGKVIDLNYNNDNSDVDETLTIDNCTFTGNTCTAVGMIEGYKSELNVENSTFSGNTAGSTMIFTATNGNINGNIFSNNTYTAEKAASVMAGPWIEGQYDIAINENAFQDTAKGVWVEQFAAYPNAVTTYNLDSNYWNGGEPNYGITGEPAVTVDDYYLSYENGVLGELTNAAPAGLTGEGTATNPYLINNIDDLKWFRDDVNAGNTYTNQYVKLTADIDLTSVENWEPIGNSTNKFLGHFDGGNNTISNLKINNTNSYIGLFGYTSGGSLKNLTLNNVDIDARLGVGALVGCPFTSDIDNIKLTGKVTIDAAFYVGGVAGRNAYGDLTNITVDVTSESYVKATSTEDGTAYRTYVGGVVGFLGEGNGVVKNVTSNIKVIGDVCDIGGIAGIAHYGNTFENVTFSGTVEATEGATEVGGIAGVWHNQAGQTVTFTNVTVSEDASVKVGGADVTETQGLVGGAYNPENETADTSGSLVVDGKDVWLKVAAIGETKYATLADAIAAANSGDTITMLCDVTLEEAVTLPADIIFNGNGKTIDGTVYAYDDLTFEGYTTIAKFGAYGPTITIGEGATLETTSGRMVIGHGTTFNITGSITDAKTANVVDLTPSLVAPGVSFTGAGVNFNVKNAYVKFTAYCSSKNSNASGTYNIDVTNSIWDQTGSLVFSEPTNGMDPTFNFTVKDSVLNSTSHLVFAVTKGEIIFDNSLINKDVYRQLENRSNLTIKNGSVVYASVATSQNAINPGTTIVDNATYITTGEFSGTTVGTGSLILKNGATATVPKIGNATVTLGAGCTLTCNTADIDISTDAGYEVKYENGVYTAVKGNVAKIGDDEYATLEEAFKAATSGCTIEILSDVVFEGNWDDRNTGSKFTVPVTINGNNKTIKIIGSLSDPNGPFLFKFEADATVNNLIIDISEVTNAKATAISAKADITIDGCTFIGNSSSSRGVRFGEGAGANIGEVDAKITNSTFTNFSRGITDNENGGDAKSVTITGNTFNNANVYLSAFETVTFTGNTVTGGYVDIRSYTADNSLDVTATGNTLTANTETKYNYINAGGTIDAQDGFVLPASGEIAYRAYVEDTDAREAVKVDLQNVSAKTSVVVKLYDSNDNLLITTTLKAGACEADWLTTNIVLSGTPSGSWDTVISAEKLTVANVPTKVELWIDGDLLDTFEPALGNATDAAAYQLPAYLALDCVYKEAKVNDTYFLTLAEAIAAAQDGETVELLADVELDAPITIKNSIIIDGNNKTITQSDACNNNIALLYFEGAANNVLNVTVKNATFDGLKTGAAIRTLYVNMTIDNCVFQNCEHTVGQGLVRLTYGSATIKGSKFLNNNCSMGVSFNWDGAGLATDTLTIDNCEFTGNTANKTALVYYVKGIGCEIKNSEFNNNKVNCTDNGATIYLGFQDNCKVTNNLFQNNVVTESGTSTRVAGTVFAGYQATITDNVFVNNTASNGNSDTLGQVCISTYYEDGYVNLSSNYWGGNAPVYGVDYTIQHQTGAADYGMEDYYAEYTTDVNGNLELSDKKEITYVATVGTRKFTSLAEAVAAAQDGNTIVLLDDVALAETIKISDKAITLDLNGKTITGTDNNTSGNFYLFNNTGTLTVKDSVGTGKITLTAATDRDWNASSVIIATNPGGKLIVESGTIEHLGGTDMAYALDNLTNGKGTYAETVINGGTIKSTYRAVRQFLNGIEAQNILTINGGTVEGTNKSIFFHDPSTKANTGALTVSENAVIKGDVYLFVTEGSTEWPVEVSIAAAALADGSTVTSKNVPDGYEVKNDNGTWGVVTVELKEFYGTNLTLGNELDINFAFSTEHVENTGYAEIVRSYADDRADETITVQLSDCAISGSYYVIKYAGMAAKEMCDEIKVTVYDADGEQVSVTRTDSIRDYILRNVDKDNLATTSTRTVEETRTLLIDMLNYGAAAQTNFEYNTDDLANSTLTDAQKAYGTQTTPTCENTRSVTYANTDKVAYLGTQFVLESKISMRIAILTSEITGGTADISFVDHYDVEQKVTINAAECETDGSYTLFKIDEIVVADGRCDVTCVFKNADGEEVVTVVDSMESYVARNGASYPWLYEIMKFSDAAYASFH